MSTTQDASALDALRNKARAIRSIVSEIEEVDSASKKARDDATTASQTASTRREETMGKLASLAAAEGWTVPDINTAASMACGVAVSNESLPKSVATFVGEAKRAMHPDVRAVFPRLAALRSEVWATEKEVRKADKTARAPLMEACAREYHALVQMCGAVIDGATFNSTTDVIAWAEARDPAMDPKKQADKIASILDQLAAISNTFPDQDLLAGIDTLKAINAEALAKARADLLGRDEARLAAHPLAPVPTVVAERVEAATASPNEHDTAADVVSVDPLDAALDALAA